jgi:hypothetical protein
MKTHHTGIAERSDQHRVVAKYRIFFCQDQFRRKIWDIRMGTGAQGILQGMCNILHQANGTEIETSWLTRRILIENFVLLGRNNRAVLIGNVNPFCHIPIIQDMINRIALAGVDFP